MDTKDKLWKSAKKINGKDPKKYRKDPYGNEMFYDSYNKDTKMGWTVSYIKPKSKGGSDHMRNLQAMSIKKNKQVGGKIKKKSRHSKRNK